MTRRMLIDATHEEETRVVVMDGSRVVDYDAEIASKRPLKGNIYLAKITRVEPSLQAAFVEYGGNRHGFLAFNEIHPDYYRIPIADREKLIEEEARAEPSEDGEEAEALEEVGGDDLEQIERERGVSLQRRYKIQEVIKRRQILLVQVVKEERGSKGAALTTYLSLPGRYCVLMPNTARGGGISRKITNARDRKRLKSVIDGLGIAEGMAVILRTAGSERSKAEIKRDYDYLIRLWDEIREMTLASTAPALIYEEGNLIKRSIRDIYTKDIDEILVDGEESYKTAKDFMRTLIPSHAKKVKKYAEDGIPLFQRYQAESHLETIHGPTVQLRSGGYIVIHQTEALVAIDVNSGRATRERHIEETALKTNGEAAEEIARQLRLRDLAGLIVIDFIDMEEHRNNHTVERRFKDALRNDRARIQIGRISPFGLLEMSRQRLRPSLIEITGDPCPHCAGTGFMRSTDWTALQVLRAVEEECLRGRAAEIVVTVAAEVALYILNQKRHTLSDIEARNNVRVIVRTSGDTHGGTWEIEISKQAPAGEDAKEERRDDRQQRDARSEESGGRKRRRGRRRRGRQDDETETGESEELVAAEAEGDEEETTDADDAEASQKDEEDRTRRRRRRGRRGGRRRTRQAGGDAETAQADAEAESADDADAALDESASDALLAEADAPDGDDAAAAEPAEEGAPDAEESDTKPKRRTRRSRSRKSAAGARDDAENPEDADVKTPPVAAPVTAEEDRDEEPEAAAAADDMAEEREAPPEDVDHGTDGNGMDDRADATDDSPEQSTEEEQPEAPESPRRGWWQRVVN